MTNKKMTYAVALDNAIAAVTDEETIERLTALKASLAKRNTKKAAGGVSKVAQANAAIAEKLIEVFEPDVQYSSADLTGIIPELEKATPTKIASILKPMIAEGRVISGKVKGKVVYSLA